MKISKLLFSFLAIFVVVWLVVVTAVAIADHTPALDRALIPASLTSNAGKPVPGSVANISTPQDSDQCSKQKLDWCDHARTVR